MVKFFYLILIQISLCQEIPIEFFKYSKENILFDSGNNWENNSTLNSIRFQNSSSKESINKLESDSLYIKWRAGSYIADKYMSIYGYGHFIYQKYFFGYLYPRIVNRPDIIARYSGVPMDRARGGFNSGETDLSGIGFQNNWLTLQIGRGREKWGANDNISLILNNDSKPYDYFVLGSDYNNIRVRYFHGFLESKDININRYVVGRGIEYTNKESIVLGISEVVIYSGKNRGFDFSYLNPISTHLEIELNERENTSDSSSANACWQVSLDLFLIKKLRLSFNYLLDEYVIDEVEKKEGKINGSAVSYRVSYSLNNNLRNQKTIYFSFLSVGTHTFRHDNGFNNFVHRGSALGWEYGSDGREIKLGYNYFNKKNLIIKASCGLVKYGQESLIFNPYGKYSDYLIGKFPSGSVTSFNFYKAEVEWWIKNNLSFTFGVNYKFRDEIISNIGLNIFFGSSFKK